MCVECLGGCLVCVLLTQGGWNVGRVDDRYTTTTVLYKRFKCFVFQVFNMNTALRINISADSIAHADAQNHDLYLKYLL